MREIRASLDCAAFDDGEFAGPDSLGAFERLQHEREAELMFIAQLLQPGRKVEVLLAQVSDPASGSAARQLARKLSQALDVEGREAVLTLAREHRMRIVLHRGF